MDGRSRAVVVTGAASGIGRALSEELGRRGTPVVLCDVDAPGLDTTRQKINGAAWTLTADVTNREDVDRMTTEARRLAGPIGGLVNCAGIYPVTPLLDLAVDEWDRVMAVNLRGPFLVTQAVARGMIADGGGGSIVNISSTSSRLARPGIAHYGASKAGLNQLTAVAAVELAPHGIRVNAILPGVIGTERVQATAAGGDDARAEHAAKLARIPMSRVGDPMEVVSVALFLLSPESSYCTGALFTADGGFTLGIPHYR
ncbi:MAG TPA: SDR family oxidoreductase [Candidatus Acidoferrum sp.]|nr:SDR family oxidoreductase [Candidatus Acidoferrum sp.]